MSVFLSNLNSSNFGKLGGSILDGLVSNNCREDEILSYIRVGKKSISTGCFHQCAPFSSARKVEFI